MIWTLLVVLLVATAAYFAIGIASHSARRQRLAERPALSEDDWLARHGDSFAPMPRRDVLAGLRFAMECVEVDAGRLLPEDRWGVELASHPRFARFDPARKDWEQLAQARNHTPSAMGDLTLREFIEYYGPRPEAQAFLEEEKE